MARMIPGSDKEHFRNTKTSHTKLKKYNKPMIMPPNKLNPLGKLKHSLK